MSTAETAAPVLEVPPKDETPATINVEEHQATNEAPVNIETAATTTPSAAKVTPVQRLNSVFNKAKQTFTDVYSEAQKAINEKKTTITAATTSTPAAADAPDVQAVTTTTPTDKKVGATAAATATFKDILNRVKVNVKNQTMQTIIMINQKKQCDN